MADIARTYVNSMPKTGTIKDRKGKDLIEAEEIKKRWQRYTQKNCTKKVSMSQITTVLWSLT